MIFAGIAILTGAVLAAFFPYRIDVFWLTFLPICLYLAYINPKWRAVWLVVGSFLWTTGHVCWQLDQRLDDGLNNKRVTLVGEVINIPRRSDYGSRFFLKPDYIQGYEGRLPGLIRLSWRKAPSSLAPGQIWRLSVKLKQPHGYQNPGAFDYERWLFVKGIHATGYVRSSTAAELLSDQTGSLNNLRFRVNEAIARFCENCRYAGLIQALSIGYRGNIEPAQRLLLQQTGTAHLIAISGLHIGIIAGVFYALGLLLWKWGLYRLRMQRRELALSVSFVAALIYSLMAGFDLPAQRAMLMLTVLFIGLWSRTSFNLVNSIFITLILVLIFSPLAVLSESFWLSFSALFVIALGAVLFHSQRSWVARLVVIQLLFSLLFIPISIVIFGQVHVASLLANLVAVPVVSFIIVPLNFILLSVMWLPQSWMELLYSMVDRLLALLLAYLDGLQQLGLQAYNPGNINEWKVAVIVLALLILITPRGLILSRAWLWVLIPVIVWPDKMDAGSDLAVAVLDVGMGTSVVVQTRHHSLVYDFGPGNRQGYSLGKWALMPYLNHKGIRAVDRIVVSHADQDHLGGLYGIHTQLQYGAVYSGTPNEVKQLLPALGNVVNCHTQDPWLWDGVVFEFVAADVLPSQSENDRSCVLRIQLGQQRILISGDIESSQEQKLLQLKYNALPAQILIAPHHGSMTSSSTGFIQAVNAKNVIFTSGYLNRWRFPRTEILQRYVKTGATIYRTDEDGAILIDCQQQQCDINRFRQHSPRLWY